MLLATRSPRCPPSDSRSSVSSPLPPPAPRRRADDVRADVRGDARPLAHPSRHAREGARGARAARSIPSTSTTSPGRRTARVPYTVLPEALTGVWAPIVVLSGRHFPTGSHKVGPAYSILAEKQVEGQCAPGEHTLVFPSTGQLRDRRGLGRPAHGLPLAGRPPGGHERGALREDPRLRRGGGGHAGLGVERQGDLRQGQGAARDEPATAC